MKRGTRLRPICALHHTPRQRPDRSPPACPGGGTARKTQASGERQDEDWETGREGRSGREEGGTYKGVGKQRCVGHSQDGQSYFNRDHLVLLHNANAKW